MRIKNIVVMGLVLMLIWVLLTSSFDILNLIIGFGLSVFLALALCRNCDVFAEIKLTPKAFIYTIVYLFVFFWDLIKSNVDVALRVIRPSLPINPGIVKVRTRLKSPMGRMILANSITLTPGTLTIDIREDMLYIHWIDVRSDDIEQASKDIVSKFEKYLEVIYG